MIKVHDIVAGAWEKDSMSKKIIISFPNGEFRDLTNGDIVAESVVFTESVCSNELKFGLFEGATLEFETFFNENIKNLFIYAKIGIDVLGNGTYTYVPYGYFYVDSCKKSSNGTRKIIAYQNKYQVKSSGKQNKTKMIALTDFERLKFNSEGSSNTYTFNHLFAYASAINDAETIINDLLPLIPNDCNITTDNNVYVGKSHFVASTPSTAISYSTEAFVDIPHEYMGEVVYKFNKNTPSAPQVQLKLYGVAVAFTGLKYLNNCMGQIEGIGPRVNYLMYGKPNTLYEFNWEYENVDSTSKIAKRHVNRLNREIVDRNINCTIDEAVVKNAFTPSVTCLGYCTTNDDIEDDNTVTLYYDEPHRYYFNTAPLEGGKLVFAPFTDTVTDYAGKSISGYSQVFPNDGSKLGCVGYTVFIPMKCSWYIDNSLITSTDFIEELNQTMTLKSYTINGIPLNKVFETGSKQARAICAYAWSGTKTANVYDASKSLQEFEENNDLQDTFSALLELLGKFGKFDRNTNAFKLIDFERGADLYPADDLFPSNNLFPTNGTYHINRTIWKSLLYDETLTQKYNEVRATWKNSSDVDVSLSYVIVSPDEMDNNIKYTSYDISNNYFIQNNILDVDALRTLINGIREKLKYIDYYPCTMELRGLPFLEAGDFIAVLTRDGGFYTCILRHRISGIQALMDSIESR